MYRPHLFLRLLHTSHHMTDSVDFLAGTPSPGHAAFALAATLVALTHRNHHHAS